ncbi:MAG: DoxX family membrane protein [Flavobacterium sp.]|nr:DoxX family membrane protein [Pedobacter sp.]
MKRHIATIVFGILLIVAGLNHFVNGDFYLKIMPPYLPKPELLIVLSGIAEIICGLALLIKKTRRLGGWLTILLLIAVFPANVQMTINGMDNRNLLYYLSIGRLIVQILLIWWIFVLTKPVKIKS